MIRLSIFSLSAVLGATLAFGSFACSKSSDADPGEVVDTTDGGGETGTFGGETGTTQQAACADDNRDIFVVADDKSLYSFHPPTLTFTLKGIIDCPTGGATPTSMAVDRGGTAWVRHSDGSVWLVNTQTLACAPTNYQPPSNGFQKFGMGFSTESNGGSTESLFLSDSTGEGLAKLNTKTLELDYIGAYTGDFEGYSSELTGTGAGKLYGLFTTQPMQIAEISKGLGDVVPNTAKVLNGTYAGDAWAFSFYAGDFYVYTAASGGDLPMSQGGSTITKLAADGTVSVLKTNIGFKIVGAGVSTCAPTTAVK